MSRVHVSDYALLRWLERVEGVNVNALRRRIAKAVRRGAQEGAKGVKLDGVTFKLQSNPAGMVVTTVQCQSIKPHLAEPRLIVGMDVGSGDTGVIAIFERTAPGELSLIHLAEQVGD